MQDHPLIDRLLKAKPKHFDPDLLATARHWLHGYMVKLGLDPHQHPPDDLITAQFLAVADWIPLERLLYDLMAERQQPGNGYAWFVSVALQRIHGIKPTALKSRRAQLKLLRHGHRPDPPPGPQFVAARPRPAALGSSTPRQPRSHAQTSRA